MSTLLLELRGPQQSWGSRSRFSVRATETAPTRSGVLGLLAAALGMPRESELARFAAVRFGVRIDQPGRMSRDFQTTRSLDGSVAYPLSARFFLADAAFLVGIEHSDSAELERYQAALTTPVFPLYLGRRAFPPAGPIRTDLVDADLGEALSTAAWRASAVHRHSMRNSVELECIVDAVGGEESLHDDPISFDPRRRRYAWRDVHRFHVALDNQDSRGGADTSPGDHLEERSAVNHASHDPFELLSGGD